MVIAEDSDSLTLAMLITLELLFLNQVRKSKEELFTLITLNQEKKEMDFREDHKEEIKVIDSEETKDSHKRIQVFKEK